MGSINDLYKLVDNMLEKHCTYESIIEQVLIYYPYLHLTDDDIYNIIIECLANRL